MKKSLVIIALLLIVQTGWAQYFNHLIPDYNFNSENRQTITTDQYGDIVFISQNTISPDYPKDFNLIKLDGSGNQLAVKRVFDSLGSLTPVSVISTYDGGYIVIGIYEGKPTTYYPPIANTIHTTFYAKFDNSFNMVWFRLHYGYPLSNIEGVAKQVEPHGIVAIPGGPVEDYVVLNFGSSYDTVTHIETRSILIDRIDEFGNLVREVRPTVPSHYVINSLSSISYLPTNNLLAVNGAVYDASVYAYLQTPFIFTFDPGLTTVYNYTRYTSAYDGFVSSNVIEDQSNPSNLLFCYTTSNPSPYPMDCSSVPKASSLVYLEVQAASTSTILVNKDYTGSCMLQPRGPLTIKNIPGQPDRAMIGFTEVQPIGPGGLSYNPALLKIGTDGSAGSYHFYNPYQNIGKLQYFENYNPDFFVLHVNNLDTPLSTRIVRADAEGRSFCADVPTIIPFVDSIVGVDSTLDLIEDSSALIKEDPILYKDDIKIEMCDSTFRRPVGQSNVDGVGFNVFPNPASDEINVVLSGGDGDYRELKVLSSLGQVVMKRAINSVMVNENPMILDVSKLPAGLYFIQLSGNGTLSARQKFIKE